MAHTISHASPLLCFYIVETLNGNLVLKSESKTKITDYVENEIYAITEEDAKIQFKQYKNEIRKTLR